MSTATRKLSCLLSSAWILFFIFLPGQSHATEAVTLNETEAMQEGISGQVIDSETGEPLPGVNIMVLGSDAATGSIIGTQTDLDGEFSLQVPEGLNTLVFTYIGYQREEVEINGQTQLAVEMVSETIAGEEIVVVGYGTMRSQEVTSSIATISERDFNRGVASSSPLQVIQGRVAGLSISRAHGGDPTEDVEMLLRGVSTIQGDLSPLIVIDGIPGGNLNMLAPADIESINVLRDGSAAAIYGTRGNAGVIIVTTKQGIPGQHSISYSGNMYTETWHNKPRVLNASEYNQLRRDFETSGNPLLESRAISLIDYGHETDWFDAIVRDTPISQEHNLSFSGGSQTTNYHGSLNYRDLQGFIQRSGRNVLNARLSLTHRAFEDRLTVQANLNNTVRNENPVNYQAYRQALGRNPTMPIYNNDGSFFEVEGWEMFNPVALLHQYQRDDQFNELLASGRVVLQVSEELEMTATGAVQNSNFLRGLHESRDSWASIQGGYSGSASRNTSQERDQTFEYTLNHATEFGVGHQLTSMAGYSFQEFFREGFNASNRFFITDEYGYNNLGAGLHLQEGNYQNDIGSYKRSNRLVAFFGRVNYNFADTYMVTASLRHEGSSRFGDGNKWGNFPAVSVGWTVSNEPFMQGLTFLDNLRLRAGYGVTGNQGIGDYISLERLQSVGAMYYEGTWIPGYAPGSNPNPDLRWETKSEFNVGFDMALLNHRLNINIDLYDRSTRDLLYEYPVPVPPNLFPTLWTNVGDLNNRGAELTIDALLMTTTDFQWRSGFNISYNRNKLVSLSDDLFSHSPLDHTALGAPGMTGHTVYRLEEGEPIGNIMGWRHAGFTDDGRWLFWNLDMTEQLTADEITFDDRVLIGNGLPKSVMGFSNSFNYGNLDLTISLRGAFGFHLVNTRRNFYENITMAPTNILRSALDTPLVDEPQFSDYYVERGDYVKLDNVTIGYNLPIALDVVRNMRVTLSGQNLHTWTGYSGQDPEISIEGLSPGMDYRWIYPAVRTFSLGLDIQF